MRQAGRLRWLQMFKRPLDGDTDTRYSHILRSGNTAWYRALHPIPKNTQKMQNIYLFCIRNGISEITSCRTHTQTWNRQDQLEKGVGRHSISQSLSYVRLHVQICIWILVLNLNWRLFDLLLLLLLLLHSAFCFGWAFHWSVNIVNDNCHNNLNSNHRTWWRLELVVGWLVLDNYRFVDCFPNGDIIMLIVLVLTVLMELWIIEKFFFFVIRKHLFWLWWRWEVGLNTNRCYRSENLFT